MQQGALVRIQPLLVALFVLLGAPGASRAVDLSAPIACALTDVFDCSGKNCTEVESEAVGLADLLRLDPAAKQLKALDDELGGVSTALESLSVENGKLGARAHEGERTLVLAVDEKTGDAILTVTDLHFTVVAYGECAKF